ncbi:hypothetical protein FF38_12344 [Lucilia cuprina]|uniref:Uncharacterized protein n=1 Tax=Lucilia cuprina TaxID=7375 RepID=A0A0L0C7W3_LUCCU|nr:hypothetical protein CVS40_5637 [Lucilia cuprina]KNC27494.1 hypothetical protein FF38_12344 [Lucilia cuprina]
MADVNKPKLQLRSGLSLNGDKTPSPATKLLINHGKPNFTIQKSPKALNGNANPMSPPPTEPSMLKSNHNNNNEFVVKSTTFNGVFKPSNISAATKQTLPQNGNSSASNGNDNEAAKVVLRRTKVVPAELRENEEDSNVPEFILRQRRIQERLANQNILDFENRRSGYFTQVMISPSSPNRQSFVETMSSPAVKPGLEMPPPASSPSQHEDIKEETLQEQQEQEESQQQEMETQHEKSEETVEHTEPVTLNGQVEEEEVAKAIEEVNKAVAGEDDTKDEEEQLENHVEEVEAVETQQKEEETKTQQEKLEPQADQAPVEAVETSAVVEEKPLAKEETETHEVAAAVVTSVLETAQEQVNGHVEAVATSAPVVEEQAVVESQTNGHVDQPTEQALQNGHATNGQALENEITISHTNGLNGPSLPSPDPKGEKGVNFEPKTVVSFSQELGNDVNKYPDTVKVVKETEASEVDNELRELTKLKFEIKGDDKDIEVKPVLITETA